MVVLYSEAGSRVPFIAWFYQLSADARFPCLGRIRLLKAEGHRLRRPAADYLRDGIYELRFKSARTQFRVLYFFHERTAVVSHGFRKLETAVPQIEIERALKRKAEFESAPHERTARHEEWPEDLE